MENGKIYSAIVGVMQDVGSVGKDQYNPQQKFKYRGIDDVMNALHPAMVKHGIFVAPEVLEQSREERTSTKGNLLIYSICRIRFRFYAGDGSYIDVVTIGEGMDSGDKATNKAMAIAFKYACFQTFCIPTEEMQDPDAESPEAQPKWKKAQKQNTKEPESGKVTKAMINALFDQLKRTGVGLKGILTSYGLERIDQMTVEQFKDAMDRLSDRPDKEVPPQAPADFAPNVPDADEHCGLPFR